MCMGVSWTPYSKRTQYDRYLNIRNMPECDEAMSGRSQWEEDYPKRGIDFNIWKQSQTKGDKSCSNGIYSEMSDLCFRYKVMTQVCIFIKLKHDSELNQYSWVYTGGCFEGGKPVNYDDLRPGEIRTFKDV